jgi:hypothetical protein
MKLGIMQPYFFPYIGYFQLIHAVDKFIILDDVNFIKRGWINRNRITINGKEYLFSIPIKNASQNKLILECELSDDSWKLKFLKTIELSYRKAPSYNQVFPLLVNIVNYKEKNLSRFIFNQLLTILDFLKINALIISSSSIYKVSGLKSQEKIISICKIEKATHYINPIGGIELYNKMRFIEEGIHISFLQTKEILYSQFSENFIPNLSIIDVMMFNPPELINQMLNEYQLI